jgi:hypothetical protein
MLDRSTPNLFHTDPSAAEAPTAVIPKQRTRPTRPARGVRSPKSLAGLTSPRLSSVTGEGLRGAASRLLGAKRYLPLSIALVVVLSHDLAGGGRPTAPARPMIAAAPTVKPTVIPRPPHARARRHASLLAHPATGRPRLTSRPAQVHARHRVIYPRRIGIVPARSAAPAAQPAPTTVTPNVTPPPPPASVPAVASKATARSPSEHSAEFGFEP